jgi:hypothetical protein
VTCPIRAEFTSSIVSFGLRDMNVVAAVQVITICALLAYRLNSFNVNTVVLMNLCGGRKAADSLRLSYMTPRAMASGIS